MLAVRLALGEWRHWLELVPFVLWTDHRNLENVRSAKLLNFRQACWVLFFGHFNSYRLGTKNCQPNVLSWCFVGLCYWPASIQWQFCCLQHDHSVALPKPPSVKETAWVVTDFVFWIHCLVEDVVFDRPKFVSHFQRELCHQIGASAILSSLFHPQANGQTERSNKALEWMVRCLSSQNPFPWSQQLMQTEYAHNFLLVSGLCPVMCCFLCFLPRVLRFLFPHFRLSFSVVAIPGVGQGRL